MDFSLDGKQLAGVNQSEVKIWDPQTGQELLKLSGGDNMADFSPDGKRIASGPKVFDLQTGQELLTFDGVRSVFFSPDGKRLVGFDKELLKVFDAQTGKELLSIPTETSRVSFSPNGKRLASGAVNGEINLWDAETGVEIRSFKRHAGPVTRVMFIQDGTRLVSVGHGTVRIWDVPAKQGGSSVWRSRRQHEQRELQLRWPRVCSAIYDRLTKETVIKIWIRKPARNVSLSARRLAIHRCMHLLSVRTASAWPPDLALGMNLRGGMSRSI